MNSTNTVQIKTAIIGGKKTQIRIEIFDGKPRMMDASTLIIVSENLNVNHLEQILNDIKNQFPNPEYNISFIYINKDLEMGILRFNPICKGLFEKLLIFCNEQNNITAMPDDMHIVDHEDIPTSNIPQNGMCCNCLYNTFTFSSIVHPEK
jgi:hypothetical protein